ncbi:MAG: amino acid permease [Endomicrobium sp.]|jgi:AAT family amino acid transporter|nr:amino acid permease [Endomicrobium sp.]
MNCKFENWENEMVQSGGEGLKRSLSKRHVQLIAIGGAIGVGLFLASGDAIASAGPSLLLSYLLGGFFIYFIMRALGEIAVEYPISGSFSAYAHEFISPCAGFIVGWTFWLLWTVSCMVQVTAIGIYCNFWWSELPRWIPALAALVCITVSNLLSVKSFGEIAFWSSIIKVITIVLIIIVGAIILLFGLGSGDGNVPGISNLFKYGFFANGLKGVFFALTMVTFAFIGVEFIGITAGEAENPEKTIPSVINRVLLITLSLYVGTLFIIMCMYPWPEFSQGGGVEKSPFVLTFAGLGIKQAAAIINFVIITASLSTANSGMFSNGRMLHSLALQKQAPKFLAKVNSRRIPSNAVIASFIFCLIGVVLNVVVPAGVFMMLLSITTFLGLFIWGAIIVVQMYSRRGKSADDIAKLKYPMLFYPYSNYIVLAALVIVSVMLAVKNETRTTFIVGPIWLILLYCIYKFFVNEKKLNKN